VNWLLANSTVALTLALLVAATGRWLRPAPAVMHVLWLFVLLKLVTPPLFEVPVWIVPAPVGPHAVAVDLTAPLAPPTSAVVAQALPPSPAIGATTPSLGEVLFWLWTAGSFVFVVLLGVGIARGCRRLRSLAPVPTWLRAEVAVLAGQLGVRVPILLDDPHTTSPCVWSLGRARLLLPARALARTSAKGRAAVLAHELAHLHRGDHRIACLELLLAAVLWWHPLFWLARARLRLWAELACDAWAVACVPDSTLAYATVLIDAVARPDSAVSGMTVLAARPAARAAFERRLQMILNETVPCRASRGWWLPFATLGLGLFAVPVAAQEEQQEPVRIEIKVNGRKVDEMSAQDRRALLTKLLREEEAKDADSKPKGATRKLKPKSKAAEVVDVEPVEVAGLHDVLHKALGEAKVEIQNDKDLRELGITDEVSRLIDDIAAGKGMQGSIDGVIKAAMKGAGHVVVKELQNDKDLRDLGLGDGIAKMVNDLLSNERNQEMFGDFVRRAAEQALSEVKAELRHDPELEKLGITVDVENLIDSVVKGDGKFQVDLQKVIDKAMRAALQHAPEDAGSTDATGHDETKPEPKKKAKAPKKQKRVDPTIR